MTTFDNLAEAYHSGRLGYANDIYNYLVGFGLAPTHRILDVGCGTGLACGPLIENGYNVTGVDPSQKMLDRAQAAFPESKWLKGNAEALPFDDKHFDAAISGQAFHHFDQTAALREIRRVVRPGGLVAVWWKSLLGDDPVKQLRDSVSREIGIEPPPLTWRGSFREFYGAGFSQNALRVIPWSTVTTLGKFLDYERSRKVGHDVYGSYFNEYMTRLTERLRETFGEGDPLLPLSYMQYLYLAKN